ncbi:putative ribonuclease H-like domain-containing protein [Tanacetum coccineum]
MNMALIEAARTILADSLLPTTFWAEVVSTAYYIFNWVRVTKPQNKTPYELQVKQKTDVIFISQNKYVADMLKKFDLASVKTAITPIETKMALTKDEEADEVTLKTSHLNVVKRIFKYLKGKPNLGLWYPRESSFDLEAYSDSDYVGANIDRKSITGEAEYVAAASCCGQNLVYHSKTKHIEIRHHFIRDSYEKKLIRVEKIHTDFNVADLLTKAFDGPRFNFLVVNIGYTWIARRIGAWIKVELKLCKS